MRNCLVHFVLGMVLVMVVVALLPMLSIMLVIYAGLALAVLLL